MYLCRSVARRGGVMVLGVNSTGPDIVSMCVYVSFGACGCNASVCVCVRVCVFCSCLDQSDRFLIFFVQSHHLKQL